MSPPIVPRQSCRCFSGYLVQRLAMHRPFLHPGWCQFCLHMCFVWFDCYRLDLESLEFGFQVFAL
jgi:hypothetical protein